ncbi:hypothetical protein FIA58_004570 [Flavobacterium jejuense]|uniref:Carboxypeptidase regulatory-like domain-containing protein n=1 Tax=Flavobacterium jejuense TaxID=1544455 RepID=A0ABX0ISZ9_9FLAO|nr:hypothetical protein [Flavobacterium jejuense]NHN24945.1 hypothetical protein [Flavobacterium jejuense]
MSYTFKGNLRGQICEDCYETLFGIEVVLYLPWRRGNETNEQAPYGKDIRIVTAEEANKRKDLFVAKTTTDANGNFEFSIDDKYQEYSFDIDVIIPTVPFAKKRDKSIRPVQLHLATVYPQQLDIWNYVIPFKVWCNIRGKYFDAWVICGQLYNCETNKPIEGATVTAWDADFITDDNLGSATTDSNGHFRIDYDSLTFKKTFLSPWINVETDPGLPLRFQNGPDVYFKATLAGEKLVDETKADARKNVDYCLCVKLCSEINVIDENDTFDSAWTGFGDSFSASFGTGVQDFDADGYAGANKNVLYSTVALTGQAPLKATSGNRIKYRFLISDVTTPNGTASPADANFTKIIGVTPGLFAASIVIKLDKKVPTGTLDTLPVISNQADFDVEGWFDVTNAIERTLTNNGYATSDLSLFKIIDTDTLISLNTASLTSQPNVPDTPAGVAINPANHIQIEKFAIRFQIGELLSNGTISIQPTNGKTLNSVIMNNNSLFMILAIKELEETTLCSPISGTVHAKYTVYHPYLQSFRLNLNNNSLSVNRGINDAPFMPLSANTDPTKTGHANLSLPINNPPADMEKCTYALKLYAQTRLHNGRNQQSQVGPVEQLFFYDI